MLLRLKKRIKKPFFQHNVTGVSNITAVASRFKLTWLIYKDDVSSISCDGDCDVIIWVNTRSSNTFTDSFGSWEYIGMYFSRSVARNFTQLLTLNVIIFNVVICLCGNMTFYVDSI